jgi:hypothetical protein
MNLDFYYLVGGSKNSNNKHQMTNKFQIQRTKFQKNTDFVLVIEILVIEILVIEIYL